MHLSQLLYFSFLLPLMKNTNVSRRKFFKASLAGASIGILAIWDKVVKTKVITTTKKIWKIPFPRYKKISFVEEFVVVNNHGNPEVLSAHCTHLGCLINRVEGDKLVCPCHGSEFSTSGKVIKGPAYQPLKKVEFRVSEQKDFIIIS